LPVVSINAFVFLVVGQIEWAPFRFVVKHVEIFILIIVVD